MAEAAIPLRPPLKWAGGKRWQVPHLRPYWANHAHRRLVEPFCGGLAITLSLAPQSALLNDINPHVINFYRWVKRGLVIADEMTNSKAFYYGQRLRFNALLDGDTHSSVEAAGLFYYLNRTGYNGLCRFNGRGRFNVPFGRYDRIRYRTDFLPYQPAFARWEFANVDFEDLAIDEDDFICADPPYDVEFTQYSPNGFDWEEQERAATGCRSIRARWSCRIRRRRASSSCTGRSASPCARWPRRAGSAARATGVRPPKSSPSAISACVSKRIELATARLDPD